MDAMRGNFSGRDKLVMSRVKGETDIHPTETLIILHSLFLWCYINNN